MAAKTLTGNPIVISSADTFATVPASEAKVKIQALYWATGASAATADTVVVAHASGDVIWAPVLLTDYLYDRQMEFPFCIEAKGLAITPPTHGILYVYLADGYA